MNDATCGSGEICDEQSDRKVLMMIFRSGSPPYAEGDKVEPTSFGFAGDAITAQSISDAAEAVFSENGADVSVCDGANNLEYFEKLYVRGNEGKCIISTFDSEDEETGYFIDHSRDENERIEIKGDLWGMTSVCFEKATLVAILTDFISRQHLEKRADWERSDS